MVLFNLNDMNTPPHGASDGVAGYQPSQRNSEGQWVTAAKPVKRLSAYPWPFSVKTPGEPQARSALATTSFVT